VSTAANTITPEQNKSSNTGSASTRPNPVALEVPVSVTGARANSGGARELFTEETETVLVFRDGAVIRLTAPVVAGQLLFLTNKKNNLEVVCQVLHTRVFGGAAAYVDLQFTEGKAEFWGVSFSADAQEAPEFREKEHVEAEAATQADPAAVVEPHKEEEVDRLKEEVEALRRQLLELANRSAVAAGAKPGSAQGVEGVPGTGAVAARAETPLMPGADKAEKTGPARAVVGMSLPMGRRESSPAKQEKDPAEDLLPKPELDFSKVEQAVRNSSMAIRATLRKQRAVEFRKVKAPAFAVLLVTLAVILVMAKPWRYLEFVRAKNAVASTTVAQPVVTTPKSEAAAPVAAVAGKTEKGVAKDERKAPRAAKNEIAANEERRGDAQEVGAAPVEGQGAKKRGGNARNVPAISKESTAERKATEIALSDAPVLPAKLVKAANPVYPPDAMTNFITGDVRAEAMVEPDGRVGEVKVLSGPKPLREAAVEALKQYQYAPATQGGKAVASKVTVTVKFWFNP
jgi:TonB family protein